MVDSGVPQGSVLGPILYLIYVDDAARDLDCEVAMFADDMKIWSVIRGPADEDRLQMNLNRLKYIVATVFPSFLLPETSSRKAVHASARKLIVWLPTV
nr:unnamed protein product [Spirometra erinaceieuropaei]